MNWRLAATLLVLIVMFALGEMNKPQVDKKAKAHYSMSNPYNATDLALFVALPLIHNLWK